MPRARTRSRRLRSWSGFLDERFGRVWRGSDSSVREALWWSKAPDSIYLFYNGYLPVQIGRAGTNRMCFTIYFCIVRAGTGSRRLRS